MSVFLWGTFLFLHAFSSVIPTEGTGRNMKTGKLLNFANSKKECEQDGLTSYGDDFVPWEYSNTS